jgi:hypothetical protein
MKSYDKVTEFVTPVNNYRQVSFYTRVMFLKNITQVKYRIPI